MSRHVVMHRGSGIFSKKIFELNTRPAKRMISICDFEKKRLSRILLLPVLWLLTVWVMAKKTAYKVFGRKPRVNTFWFDGLGSSPMAVRNGATSWRALHEIYNYDFGKPASMDTLVSNFWESMLNCQAVRNRFKLVKQELKRAVLQFEGEPEVRIISLACGSAQPVIEVMAELKTRGILAKTVLLDMDQSALDHAAKLASVYGVLAQVKTIKAIVCQVAKVAKNFKPHVIEMVGLMDYLDEKQAVRLLSKIRQLLEPNGIFITCNICPNVEQAFLKWVVDWNMIYRTARQLSEIVEAAGFKKIRLIQEPLAIHNLVVCQNSA